MKFKYIIIHYAEIALKGHNRRFFEDALKNNIEKALKREGIKFLLKKISGRFVVHLDEEEKDYEKIFNILKNVIGIAHFSYALRSDWKLIK